MSIAEKLAAIARNEQKVYEAGKQKEWSDFWDSFQDYGKRTDYDSAFFSASRGTANDYGWTEKTLTPKYDIKPVYAGNMFYGCGIVNLKKHFEELGRTLDFSNCVSMYRAFGGCTKNAELGTLNIANSTNNQQLCYNNYLLEKIALLVLSDEGNQTFENAFYSNSSLTYLRVSGTIGRDFNIQYSQLTVESLKSVITHLKDYTEEASNHYKYTITFKTTAFDALEAEGETSPNGNTWAEYIDDLKWNLVKA